MRNARRGFPGCGDAADSNDDGAFDIADPVYTLATLFSMGPALPDPWPTCGPDPTIDLPSCTEYSFCP